MRIPVSNPSTAQDDYEYEIQERYETFSGSVERLKAIYKLFYKTSNKTEIEEFYLSKGKQRKFKEKQNSQKESDVFVRLVIEVLGMPLRNSINKDYTGQMVYVHFFTLFDSFLQDCLAICYKFNIDRLRSDKQVKLNEVLSYDKLEDLHDAIIEEEIISYGYLSFSGQVRHLKEKLKINIGTLAKDVEFIAERRAIRNLLVHNKGEVNRIFKKEFPGSRYSNGGEIELVPMFMHRTFQAGERFAASLKDEFIKLKVKPRPKKEVKRVGNKSTLFEDLERSRKKSTPIDNKEAGTELPSES